MNYSSCDRSMWVPFYFIQPLTVKNYISSLQKLFLCVCVCVDTNQQQCIFIQRGHFLKSNCSLQVTLETYVTV